MERVWLESYPKGVPFDVDVNAYRSICEVFDASVAKYGSRRAFVNMGAAVSFAELDRMSRDFAAYLQCVLKLPRGTAVALMMPNVLQYPVALFGVLRGGYVVVNCNPFYTPRELHRQLSDSEAQVVIVVENFAGTVEQAIAGTAVKHVIVTKMGDMLGLVKGAVVNFIVKSVRKLVPHWRIANATRFKSVLRRGAKQRFQAVDVNADDIAFLQYTGGTTGVAKAAMLTHGNMVANLQQAHAWLHTVLEDGREIVITALPLYHVFALTANCILFLKLGGTNVLITDPRDTHGFIEELAKHEFSVITGVNTLFNSLLRSPDFAKLDFSSLRLSVGGGMAVQRSVARKWKQTTGKALVEAYGLTEASPCVAVNPLDLADYNGSIGLPLPSTEIAIRDEDGRDLSFGVVGELCIRGPQVMKGYWKRPEETALVLMPDGFLRTGDLATIDEAGFIRIVDRKKDLIIVSGFNVYPSEIEDVAMMYPGVLEAGAYGVPDDGSGQAVRVAIVKADPALTSVEVITHFRKHLTGYKIPRHVEFRDQLPKTPIGKVLRRALSQ